jgi:rubrerythrin
MWDRVTSILILICRTCGKKFRESPSDIACPHCGGYDYEPTREEV